MNLSWQEHYVYMHMQVACIQFGRRELPHGHRVVQVVCFAEVLWVRVLAAFPRLIGVNLVVCMLSMSVDIVPGDCGKEGSPLFDFHK